MIIGFDGIKKNLYVNGFVLTAFRFVEIIGDDVEIIGAHRSEDALYFAENSDFLACVVKHEDGDYYPGWQVAPRLQLLVPSRTKRLYIQSVQAIAHQPLPRVAGEKWQ